MRSHTGASRWLPQGPGHAALLAFCIALPAGLLAYALKISGNGLYDGHFNLAESLVHGLGYRFGADEPLALHRPPVYPLLLTPVAVLPASVQRYGLVLLQSALVAVASAQTFVIGRRWFGPTIAGWAALLPLSNPWLLVSLKTTKTGFPEMCLYLALCGWFLEWTLGPERKSPSWLQALTFGAVGGLLTLTHASKLLTVLALIALLVVTLALRGNWRAAAAMPLAVVTMAVVIAPWTYRNYVVSGRFIPVATNGGYAYFAGNAHWGITGPLGLDGPLEEWQVFSLNHAGVVAQPHEVGRFWGLYSSELNETLDRRMSEHMRQHPVDLLKKVAFNGLEFYFPVVHPLYAKAHGDDPASWSAVGKRSIASGAASIYNAALIAAALVGLSVGAKGGDGRAALWICVLIAAFIAPYLPFLVKAGSAGYVLPTMPLLALLAARCRAFWPMPEPQAEV